VSSEADRIIALLDLKPHPEGGYFRETFRDEVGASGRAHSTTIYFLLKGGEISRWHRVNAAEVWHFYAARRWNCASARRSICWVRIWTKPRRRKWWCRPMPGSPPEPRRLHAGRVHGRPRLRIRTY
jgi:hypothetical protein